MSGIASLLARFHGTLVEEIVHRHPEYLSTPFTVAEIYQNLVPYRTHRDRIGIEMNGDYEHALLRLLAGEGDYLVLESEPALRALQKEVKASSPDTAIYREFAAVDVRLNPARLSALGATSASPPEAPGEEVAPPEPSDLLSGGAGDHVPLAAPAAPEAPGDAAASGRCRRCRATLPARARLSYCPFCGMDAHVRACAGCGEELEPGWRFCVACGSEVGA